MLYSEREVGGEVGLPRHWMRDFFLASLCLEVQENQEGLSRLQVTLLTYNPAACQFSAFNGRVTHIHSTANFQDSHWSRLG